MRIWLWIVLVGLFAGGAVAQADYNYETCYNRLGIFTSNSLPGYLSFYNHLEFLSLLNITYTPGEPFSVYIMVCSTTQPVLGLDASIILPPELVPVSVIPAPGTTWINIGTATNILSGFSAPVFPDIDGNVHLATLDLIPGAVAVADIFMGPSEPSGIGGAGPAFNMGGEYMRANFIDYLHSGCREPSPAVGRVAVVFGGTTYMYLMGSSPTEPHSLTAVKALFR